MFATPKGIAFLPIGLRTAHYRKAGAQAREFASVTDVSGIILTKLDGTAKGGIAVAISSEMGLPVSYIGVGEAIEDLQAFDARQFIDAIF